MTAETAAAERPARIGYHVSSWLRQRVLERDDFTCLYCGLKVGAAQAFRLHVDHIIPLAKGGTAISSNLATACRDCNQRKSDTDAAEFAPISVPAPARLQNRMQRRLAHLERIEAEWAESVAARRDPQP